MKRFYCTVVMLLLIFFYRLMDNRLLQGSGRAGDVCPAGSGAEEGCNNTLTIDIMEREIGIEIANPAQKKNVSGGQL